MSEHKLFSLRNPWFAASVGVTAAIVVVSALILNTAWDSFGPLVVTHLR